MTDFNEIILALKARGIEWAIKQTYPCMINQAERQMPSVFFMPKIGKRGGHDL
jgi:hypothetical protein